MPEQNGVPATPPVAEEVNKVEETTEETPSTPEETSQQPVPPAPEGVKEEGEIDEKGVPYKNRYMEYQRKYSDAVSELQEIRNSLPTIIEQAVAKVAPQNPEQPKYTVEQLIQFKNETEDPRSRAWAEIELNKLQERNIEEKFKRQITERETKMKVEQDRYNARQALTQKYSVMFNPDGSLNPENPISKEFVRVYSSKDAFRNDPWGEMAAADIAFANYVYQQQPNLAKKQTQLKRQVKKLEKVTQLEGSGQPSTAGGSDSLKKAYQRLEQSGDRHTAKDFMKEYLAATGRI